MKNVMTLRTAVFSLLFLLTACVSQSGTTRLVEQLVVYNAVSGYIGGDAAKAERVEAVTSAVLEQLEGDLAQATIQAIAAAVKARIDWSKLDPTNTLTVNALIDEIERALLERVDSGDLPPDTILAVRTVLQWANEAAKANHA